jgi:hypothetical protein
MRPKIVHVKIEAADQVGLFYATSPDLKGLLVAEKTKEELDRAIPCAIADLYAASYGVRVVVTKTGYSDEAPWTVFDPKIKDQSVALLIEVASEFVKTTQLHSREGAHGGRNRYGRRCSFPLSDAAQSDLWRRARDLLVELGHSVPVSGEIDDA